ncbi:MAG: AI-2E family transporter [Hahellaceae bacterium]|jgi:predicted PurR-regulated permease PerM|nr:AI-2E family transporter [Hahellaceae bacterium]
MNPTGFSSGARFLVVLASFVIVVAGIKAAESIMATLLLSGFFAILCAPPFVLMQKKGLPSWLSLLIVVVGITVIQVLFVSVLASSISEFTNDLPKYQGRVNVLLGSAIGYLAEWGIDVPKNLVQQYFDPSVALKIVANTLGSLGGVLSNAFLIIVTVIFMLFEGMSLRAKLHLAFGDGGHVSKSELFLENVKQYMTIKTLISMVTGVLIYIWLLIVGVDYALLWGLVAFLLNFVPNIGSIIAAVPAVLLAMLQLDAFHALLASLGYIFANVVMGSIIEPRYMGRGLGLSTLVVFLSLVFWGWVLGPVGMLLSIPLTIMLKMALESNDETRWMAILMSGDEIVDSQNDVDVKSDH